MILGTAIAAICLLLAVLARRHMKSFENVDRAGVQMYLEMLLKRGVDGAFIIVDEVMSKRFIQFRKYIRRNGVTGLECHFPQAPWSSTYYDRVIGLLDREKLHFDQVQGSGTPVSDFIRIDFDGDVTSATRLVEQIFIEVFGCSALSVRVRSHGISSKDEFINRR